MLFCPYNKNIEKLLLENFGIVTAQETIKITKMLDVCLVQADCIKIYNSDGEFFCVPLDEQSIFQSGDKKTFQMNISHYEKNDIDSECFIPFINKHGNNESLMNSEENSVVAKDENPQISSKCENEAPSARNINSNIENSMNLDSSAIQNDINANKFSYSLKNHLLEFILAKVLHNEKNLGFLFISENLGTLKILKEILRGNEFELITSDNTLDLYWNLIQALKSLNRI